MKQKYGEAGIGLKKYFWYQKPVFMAYDAFVPFWLKNQKDR